MSAIKENTVDFKADIYDSPHQSDYRWSVRCDPDHPGTLNLSYQELAKYNNRTYSAYEKCGEVSFDKETWEKIKHAIDGVFEKTI